MSDNFGTILLLVAVIVVGGVLFAGSCIDASDKRCPPGTHKVLLENYWGLPEAVCTP